MKLSDPDSSSDLQVLVGPADGLPVL